MNISTTPSIRADQLPAVSVGSTFVHQEIAPPRPIKTKSQNYFVVDVRSKSFFHSDRIQELARLYADVFNGVTVVSDKWTPEGAMNMVQTRLRKPGCNIALVDVADNETIIGGFFANILPGQNGWNLSEPDVLIKNEHRGSGLGKELGWLGRTYANTICMQAYNEPISGNHSKTYRLPEFPKNMWMKYGYELNPLFVQSGREMTSRQANAAGFHVDAVDEYILPSLARFIASHNGTQSSDGGMWTLDRAKIFVDFMFRHNFSTFNVAKRGDEIIAVSIGDIMPGRTGPSLVEPQCFVKTTSALHDLGFKDLTQETVAAASFYELYASANGVARDRWRQPISTIEIPTRSYEFFKEILPGLIEDPAFVGMEGDHEELSENMFIEEKDRQITLIPYHSPRIACG